MRAILGRAIGRFLADHVSVVLNLSLTDEADGDGAPALRLADFEPNEIAAAIEELQELHLPGFQKPIQIVVAADNLPELQVFVPAAGRTLTWYRNNNDSGLVIFQLKTTADDQGLKLIRRDADADVLGSVDDDSELDRRLTTLHQIVWDLVSDADGSKIPQSLLVELEALYKLLAPYPRRSLRAWTSFVASVAEQVHSDSPGDAVARTQIQELFENSLGFLGLFNDINSSKVPWSRKGLSETLTAPR